MAPGVCQQKEVIATASRQHAGDGSGAKGFTQAESCQLATASLGYVRITG